MVYPIDFSNLGFDLNWIIIYILTQLKMVGASGPELEDWGSQFLNVVRNQEVMKWNEKKYLFQDHAMDVQQQIFCSWMKLFFH